MKIKESLKNLPARMQKLPIDDRGYPIPWFVDWIDGKPEFRAMSLEKWVRAVKFKLCWVCGEQMGRYMTFVAGPMCGINRTSSEPPSHKECAHWSATNCPFLSNPEAVRRVDETVGQMMMDNTPGCPITRNPGVAMLWTCKDYSVFDDGKGGKLLHMGEPTTVEWWACGRLATRSEVIASVESGFPALAMVAQRQDGAMKFLLELRERFNAYLPAWQEIPDDLVKPTEEIP
jgi:hypothetical protein